MASIIPITLVGNNLGIRHKQINNLVRETYEKNEDFKKIQNLTENSAIDRIFKIDLASKHRDVQYIIANLKDRDMLYVSKALKAKWLLENEYKDIINPENLENHLYPHMITTAVSKMKHWVHLYLKDVQRIEEFYKYYADKDFKLAVKFLFKASQDFILSEFPKIIKKVTPRYLKIMCESCPAVSKIFYDSLDSDDELKSRYINSQKDYYNSLKSLLKSDTNMYLDITEKYFDVHRFDRFSPLATKFIMSHHKNRFMMKSELYTAWILNVQTLAECLNVEECKEIVIKLAKSSFLKTWFNYKNVEPFIKRLNPEERAAFKKKIFVLHDVGDIIEEWPYQPPSAPEIEQLGPDLFEDFHHVPWEYESLGKACKKRLIRKKCAKYALYDCCEMISTEKCKTLLDKLFDEYRFVGFEKTFYELKKRILSESSPQNRQFILLVLISKTGGREDAIASLMELLVRHSNEPPNLRAAIIRSLVKRAFIWRLPDKTWNQLLEFGRGLGLDGKPAEADCIEGLHSVFIRSLLQTGKCDSNIFEAFLKHFSDLSDYSLTTAEKKCLRENLPNMLLSAAKEKQTVEDAISMIDNLLIILKSYKMDVESFPGLIPKIIELSENDFSSCKNLLERLFRNKIGRKALFRFTYKLIETDASHVNALKHDISILDFELLYESCLKSNTYDQFFRKIQIYFSEIGGLVMDYRKKLMEKKHKKLFGRPLALVLGDELQAYLQQLDASEDAETKALSAKIKANAHMSRPGLDIETLGWAKAGTKLIANKLLICPAVEVDSNVQKLMQSKRTARLASVLARRTSNEADIIISVYKMRPTIGVKLGIKYIQHKGERFMNVWETIKPYIQEFDFSNDSKKLYVRKSLINIKDVPNEIKPEYCILIFKGFERIVLIDRFGSMLYLCHIEHLLPDVNENFIEEVLHNFLHKEFIPDKVTKKHSENICQCIFLRILLKYIYLSKSEEIQTQRYEMFMKPLLETITSFYNVQEKNELFFKFFNELLLNLKNTNVFISCEYASCLPVMENMIKWMKTILPLEQHFNIYVQVHLTMLYYKSIKQTVKQSPEVFEDERKRYKYGVKTVGKIFGRYIAREVKELMEQYFESVIDLYKVGVISFIEKYFNDIRSSDFLESIIKGIMEESKGDEVRLGMYILKDQFYYIRDEVSAELCNSFREVKNEKLQFFLFAEVY